MFLNDEQQQLANDIAERLIARGESVAVAESTSGGLVSAALLAVAGASRYYAGGRRPVHAQLPHGTRRSASRDLRQLPRDHAGDARHARRSDARTPGRHVVHRRVGRCGARPASRFGAPAGRTTLGVAGPISRTVVIETGLSDRRENMAEFATRTLRYLRDALQEAVA